MSEDERPVIFAFSEEQAARLSGVSVRQLRYWDRTDFFRPGYGGQSDRLAAGGIYSFRDVVALRTLGLLRNRYKVPLQHLRKVRERLGHLKEALWASTTLYVLNREVYFDEPETGKTRGVVNRQYPLKVPLIRIANDVAEEVQKLKRRRGEQLGQVERHRGIAHNSWVVAGTRIPVGAIQRFREAGYSVEQIMGEYPSLTREDVEAALAHSERRVERA